MQERAEKVGKRGVFVLVVFLAGFESGEDSDHIVLFVG